MLSQLLEISRLMLPNSRRAGRDVLPARGLRSTLNLGRATESTGSYRLLAIIFHFLSGGWSRAKMCPMTIATKRQRRG